MSYPARAEGLENRINQSSDLSNLSSWFYSLSLFRLMLGNSWHFDIFNLLDDGVENVLCEDILPKKKSFEIVQARCRKKFNFNIFLNRSQIFKLVKNFEAHCTCEDHRVMGSSLSRLPVTIRTPRMSPGFKIQSARVHPALCNGGAKNLGICNFSQVRSDQGSQTLSLPDPDQTLTDLGRYGKEDLEVFNRQYLPDQPIHYCGIEGSHHWEDSSKSSKRNMHAISITLPTTFNSVPSIELQTSWAWTLGFLLIFLLHVWVLMVSNPKILLIYILIIVISIILSFVVLDLGPTILFQKLWNTLYALLVFLDQQFIHCQFSSLPKTWAGLWTRQMEEKKKKNWSLLTTFKTQISK